MAAGGAAASGRSAPLSAFVRRESSESPRMPSGVPIRCCGSRQNSDSANRRKSGDFRYECRKHSPITRLTGGRRPGRLQRTTEDVHQAAVRPMAAATCCLRRAAIGRTAAQEQRPRGRNGQGTSHPGGTPEHCGLDPARPPPINSKSNDTTLPCCRLSFRRRPLDAALAYDGTGRLAA